MRGVIFLDRLEVNDFTCAHSRLVFHSSFKNTISEIYDLKVKLPSNSSDLGINFSLYNYPQNGKLVSKVEEIQRFQLNPQNGEKLCDGLSICAYDESVNRFEGLEGTAYLTSHSLILHGPNDFLPSNLLTLYFYTKSKILSQNTKYIKYSEDPESDWKRDYIIDREHFLIGNVPRSSVIFIDGPLIGGQMSTYTIELNDLLLKNEIIPVFFVKNSDSNLVTDNIAELKGKFNSDMHWAYRYLKEGERTNLFRYVDKYNDKHAKVFCYIKAFDASPQRIEIDIRTFEKYSDIIIALFDLIYYLLLVQGDLKNPQIRSIAIAEKYARSTLNLINFVQTMKNLGIIPTMNQERFA